MIKFAFHFQDRDVDFYGGHRIDLENWRLPAKAMGINTIDMIDLSSARWRMEDADIDFTAHDSLIEFEAMRGADNRLVYIENAAGLAASGREFKQFYEYDHNPAIDTYYIFGPAEGFELTQDERDFIALPVEQALPAHMAATLMAGLVIALLNNT